MKSITVKKTNRIVNGKYFTKSIFASFITLLFSGFTSAEGIYQFGTDLQQPLASTTNIFIHVPNDGDIIRTHLCRKLEGGADQENEPVSIKIFSVTTNIDGLFEKDVELDALTSPVANIECDHDFTLTPTLPATPIPATSNAMDYTALTAGLYAIELDKVSNIHYGRWDFSVVPGVTPTADVDPTVDSGNVFSYTWRINRVSTGIKDTATSADLYALVSGGFANTDYVWQIDLNEFAGSEFVITANDVGVTLDPGVSATEAGNSVSPQYPIYLSYPIGANPSAAPVDSPVLTDTFTFADDNGDLNNAFSPDGDGFEDTGNFSFTSDVDGTYELTIDLNNDGLFNAGDRILLGAVDAGILNTINWDGTDVTGATVVNGEYDVQLMLRVGEMHAVVLDAETSGGGTNDDGSVDEGGTGSDDGLTILQATDASTLVGTQVYWDDAANFGADSNVPDGALSSTATSGVHRHTWGDFTGAGIGNANYIDTYVYGNSSTVTVTLVVAVDNASPTLLDSTIDVDENSTNGTSVGTITGADTDGDFLTYSITAGNDSNLFAIDSDTGEVTVNGSVNHEEVSQHSLTVQVSDFVNTDSATITIDINDINDAPTISGTPATSVAEDSFYTFTPTGNDEDLDALTYNVANLPAWATFDANDGNIAGTPDNDDVNTYTNIEITVTSNGSLSDTLAAFSIEVTNTNDAPVAVDDVASTNEDTDVTIDVLANDIEVDVGDTLEIIGVSNLLNGTATYTATEVVFTPTADFSGIGSFTYTVRDGTVDDTGDVSITVNAVNDAPVISGTPPTSATQDLPYSFTPTASDVDGDILTFSIVNQPSWASFDINDGTLSGTPVNADVGTDPNITITVSSNGALTDSLAAFTIVVGNTNDAPVAVDDTATTDEDTDVTIDVLANDSDADIGDVLSVSVNSVVNGTTVILSNQVVFTPDENFNGTGSFIYTVSDGSFTDTASVTITVNSINDAPVISGTPSTSVAQDVAYLFTPTATDDDGDLVTFSIANSPAWSTFDTGTGTLSGTPDNDDVGDYANIIITASSQGPLTDDLDAFSINVSNVNDAPVANIDVVTTDEDTDVVIDVLANDTDSDVGDTLTITNVSTVTNGTAIIFNGQVTFTPTANVNGVGSFTYTMNDGVLSDSANVTITINSVNDIPVISGSPATLVDQDVAYSFVPIASDDDGDTLTFSIAGQPSWTNFSPTTGALTGTPTNDDIGDYANIVITANDASDSDSLTAFTITVANLNDAPIAVDDSVSTDEDVQIVIDVLANDSDADVGDTLTITLVSPVLNGTAVPENGQVTFTPDENFNGTASFSYDISDGITSASADVTITVNAINDAPVISGTPATSVLQDNAYSFVPTASDADGDLLTFAIANPPSWAGFDTGTGALTGTPTNSDVGDYANIIISVSSDGGLSDSLPTFTLSVTNTNDAPVAVDDSETTDEDIAVTIDVLANDTDQDVGDTLVISDVNTFVGGTATIVANQVLYTPNAEFSGTGSFNYIVSDGTVTDTASVTITVNNINDAPVISGTPSNSVEQDSAYSFTPTASDDDGDALTFSVTNRPSWASFNVSTGTLSGTPVNADVANYSNIVITVTSAGSLTDSLDAFNINVINVNDAPVATDDAATIDEDTVITIDVLANDTDIDPQDTLTISSITNVTNGTAVLIGSQILYTPNADFNGVGTFDYAVTDGDVTDLANVQITVISIDDAPIISGIPSTNVAQDTAYGFTPNASDADGDILVFTVTDLPVWATFDPINGRISGTPNSAEVGLYPNIKITVTAGGQSDTLDAYSITVSNVNDAPVANDDSITINEDDVVTINVLANDTDADDGDTLTVLSINSVTNGVATIENNRIQYTPNEDFNGVATIVYAATDGVLTDTATVTITVDSINDAPEISGTPATSVLENSLYLFTPVGLDDDGDTLTFSISNRPDWATFSTSSGVLTGTPDNNDSGIYGNILISVSSQGGLSDSLPAFTIEVDNVNVAPIIVDDSATTDEDVAISIDVLANDTDVDDADTLIVTAVSAVVNGTAEIVNNQVLYTPTLNFNGVGSFTYAVTDGAVNDTANVSITINSVNDAPVISGTPLTSVAQDILYTFTPTATDDDGDGLTFSINNTPSWATFSTVNGALTGTPGNDDVGSYPNIQITVTSNGGLSDSLTLFAITVTNVNDAPIAEDDLATTDEDTAVTINILINDSDLDDDELTVDSQSAINGTLVLNNDQTLLYTPNENFNGTDTITYTISDGNGGSDTAEVVVTVTSINDEPVALDDTETILEGTSATTFVLNNDSDDDGDTLTIISADATNGDVTINPDGSLTYTPVVTFVGVENIVYTLQDGNGGQAAATLVVSVNPVAIEISGTPTTSLLEGEEYAFTPTVQASSNVSYTFSITNLPTWMTFDTSTGNLIGTPERGDVATFSAIEICVDDTFAVDCLATFDIAVTGDLDRDGTGDDVDEDIDGDGMSNDFETANGLDPEDASDASEDADGDGVSNLDEFLAGTNPNLDDNPPTLLQPADVTIDATSLLNEVSIGDASATDFVDGVSVDCCEIINDAPIRYAPGTTEVIWTATDDAGNVTTETQVIKVNPIVSFAGDITVAEGEQGTVTLLLNGDAPDYPYDVVYSLTGGTATEGDDYTWTVATATFTEGTSLDINFDIAEDSVDEGVETITAEIGGNENIGAQFMVEVSISEENIAPFASLIVQQGGINVSQVQPDLGNVTITTAIDDANSNDTHTYDWSATDNSLTDTSSEDALFVFDPSNVSLGVYRIALTVTDSGSPTESAFTINDLKVVTTALDEDTGLPCNIVPHNSSVLDQYLVETQMGICIQTSQFSKLSEGGGVLLSVSDFTNQSGLSDDEHTTFGGRFDFNLQSSYAFAGYQGTVVIPLREAIPSDNLLRILVAGSWRDFDTSGADSILSAPGELGYCPPPFDSSYVAGLVTGNSCIQISITDGSANDSDSNANGVIEFTGGVHERVIPPPPPPPPAPTSSSGGGSLPLGVLIFLSLVGITRVYYRKLR